MRVPYVLLSTELFLMANYFSVLFGDLGLQNFQKDVKISQIIQKMTSLLFEAKYFLAKIGVLGYLVLRLQELPLKMIESKTIIIKL